MNCIEITTANFTKVDADGSEGVYRATVSPDLGGAGTDAFVVQFYGDTYNGDATGTFDLTMGGDDNFETCARCLLVGEDIDPDTGPAKTYFQQSGTLVVNADSDTLNGTVHGTITDLTLVEVTIDDTNHSTPVAGGACLHIATATITVDPPPVPAEWTCDPSSFNDGFSCDCGCGALDVDCAGSAGTDCDNNNCSNGNPDSAQNWMCVPVPAGWLCNPDYYADSDCDCGCGVADPACSSNAVAACDYDYCANGAIDGTNWLCTGVPAEWTCSPGDYGDGTYCDCGCGVADPDCVDAASASCDSCDEPGSCGMTDCSNIDSANNAVCTP